MNEFLSVPEEHLAEVIRVIRAGLNATKVSHEVRFELKKWCREEEAYLKTIKEDK